MLTPQGGKSSLDLSDALLGGPLVGPVDVLRHHLVQAGSELGEVTTQVLAKL
ncbi:hypothetical protein ACFYVL_14025 [Streptomyces sp. NPDC004111]|uniref:hypothetical protein n=1 Tax=Streptomyces sp. NPDC004111 TaxID=3364690 RepID=UPI0036A32BD6